MSDARCDREVYEQGAFVCSFHAPRRVVEPLVSMLATETATRTDWHYVGGYAIVKTLGDVKTVRQAARLLFPCAFRYGED